MMTPPRADLPAVGDEIAVLHCCGQWYGTPGIVTEAEPGRVTIRLERFSRMADPDHVPHLVEMEERYAGDWKFLWNRVADLSDAERVPITKHKERVAKWREQK